MIAVLAVSLAVAVIACVWLAARVTRQSRELTEQRSALIALEADLAAATETNVELQAGADAARSEAAAADQRATDADLARAAAEQDLGTSREAASAAEAQAADAEARAEAAAERAEAAEQAAAQRADDEGAGGASAWAGGPGPEVLWALEMARTERTWRTSVAADPTSDVFDTEVDPLRHAVEIDATALREEAGVEFSVVWKLDAALSPVAALAVLRGSQELLAAATRMADEASIVIAGDGHDVTIRVTDPDGSPGRFAALGDDMVGHGVEAVEGGVRIVGAAPARPT